VPKWPSQAQASRESADSLAGSLTLDAVEELEANAMAVLEDHGCTSFRTKGPRAALAELQVAVDRGLDVVGAVDVLAYVNKVDTNRKSLAQVRSGLIAWHLFAVFILCYNAAASLPPRRDVDVERC